jgi:hypothetical protein
MRKQASQHKHIVGRFWKISFIKTTAGAAFVHLIFRKRSAGERILPH